MATAKYEARQIQVIREQKRISVLVFAVKVGGILPKLIFLSLGKMLLSVLSTTLTLEKTKRVGD